jgi:quinol monooxygenase YgiN
MVKEGREDEFARRWQESVDAISLDNPGITFKLYRDRENPRRFFSMGEGWRNPEQYEAVRESPGFQDSLASIWRLLDTGDTSTFDLVVEIS